MGGGGGDSPSKPQVALAPPSRDGLWRGLPGSRARGGDAGEPCLRLRAAAGSGGGCGGRGGSPSESAVGGGGSRGRGGVGGGGPASVSRGTRRAAILLQTQTERSGRRGSASAPPQSPPAAAAAVPALRATRPSPPPPLPRPGHQRPGGPGTSRPPLRFLASCSGWRLERHTGPASCPACDKKPTYSPRTLPVLPSLLCPS